MDHEHEHAHAHEYTYKHKNGQHEYRAELLDLRLLSRICFKATYKTMGMTIIGLVYRPSLKDYLHTVYRQNKEINKSEKVNCEYRSTMIVHFPEY
jgi:hypothetical protein